MTQASITHATFTIERQYDASPARVFRAWSQAELKLRWFACHADWAPVGYELDFRVGGSERLRTGPAGGTRLVFTEQGAFLDGYTGRGERERGTAIGLDNLQALMRSALSQP
ncbi:MAG TPA: SRPBCC domain-containing protein [Telluria sp.]|nr:SRPBCC domain-containing protein [Telluria sp.]